MDDATLKLHREESRTVGIVLAGLWERGFTDVRVQSGATAMPDETMLKFEVRFDDPRRKLATLVSREHFAGLRGSFGQRTAADIVLARIVDEIAKGRQS